MALQLSLYITTCLGRNIRVGPRVGLTHFLNAAITLMFHLCSVNVSPTHDNNFCDKTQEQADDKHGRSAAAVWDCGTAAK